MTTQIEPLIDERQVAEMLQLSVKTLQAYRYQRKGPPYYKFGSKVRYRASEINDWMSAQRVVAG